MPIQRASVSAKPKKRVGKVKRKTEIYKRTETSREELLNHARIAMRKLMEMTKQRDQIVNSRDYFAQEKQRLTDELSESRTSAASWEATARSEQGLREIQTTLNLRLTRERDEARKLEEQCWIAYKVEGLLINALCRNLEVANEDYAIMKDCREHWQTVSESLREEGLKHFKLSSERKDQLDAEIAVNNRLHEQRGKLEAELISVRGKIAEAEKERDYAVSRSAYLSERWKATLKREGEALAQLAKPYCVQIWEDARDRHVYSWWSRSWHWVATRKSLAQLLAPKVKA